MKFVIPAAGYKAPNFRAVVAETGQRIAQMVKSPKLRIVETFFHQGIDNLDRFSRIRSVILPAHLRMVTQLDSRYNLSMAHTLEEARQIALELPEDQRIQSADWLLESVGQEDSDATVAEVDAAWDAEVARRVAEIKAGTAVTCSLEELEADLRTIVGP